MKRFQSISPVLVLLGLYVLPFQCMAASSPCDEHATHLVSQIGPDGLSPAAEEDMTPQMKSVGAVGIVSAALKNKQQTLGKVTQVGKPVAAGERSGNIIYVTPIHFEKGNLAIQLACEKSGYIGGLHFAPGVDSTPSSPTAKNGVQDRAIQIGNAPYRLHAMVTIPAGKGPFASVVLVSGSGPNDQDETIGPNKPFRDLAEGLAARGFVVLRYEKRTHAYPDVSQKENFTVDQEVTDDALAAIDALRGQPEVDPARVYLVAHSFGAMLAPRIAQRDGRISALVLMAPPADPPEQDILRQLRYLAATGQMNADAATHSITQLEQGIQNIRKAETGRGDTPDPASLPFGLPIAYWKSVDDLQPLADAKKLRIPLFVLRGDHDYNVTAKAFGSWKAAIADRSGSRATTYADLGHIFTPATGTPGPKDTLAASHVSKKVIDDIADWLEARTS